MKDARIVYGARCVWWDSVDKVGKHPSGLPCCPHCKGMLFELPTEGHWWRAVELYEADGHPGYRAMWEWSRGKCFPTLDALRAAYAVRDLVYEVRRLLKDEALACGMGQGAACCAFLVVDRHGFECQQRGPLRQALLARIDAMVAKRTPESEYPACQGEGVASA